MIEEDNNNHKELSSENFLLSIEEAQECLRIANLLQAHSEIVQKEKEEIVKAVTEAKKFRDSKSDILNFLQKLQSALHKKNIDVFSQLLTYFVQDVLKTSKEIKLDLYTSRGMPALNIEAINNGNSENIYVGSGGAMSNIVSTGLRLIALSRLNHRKFIVLDEPDCWLEVPNVPLFAKTIGEIAHKLKIQTLMVSHHSWEFFKDYARVIELRKEGDFLTTEIIHDLEWDVPEDLNYITAIRMQDVMSHTDTIYNLSPYMNCIIGHNDIGKSVVSTALKAVAYNDSADNFISHGKNMARTLISLSTGSAVLWERIKETTPEFPQKVRYTLYKDNSVVAQEYNSDSVPNFIAKELNIALSEEIDIHINNQKEPVFLLGSNVKPQDKAKILSLGKESLMIQKLMELVRTKSRTCSSTIKNGEERHDALLKQETLLGNIDEVIESLENDKKAVQESLKQFEVNQKMRKDLDDLKALQTVAHIEKIDYQAEEFQRIDTESHAEDIKTLQTLQKIVSLGRIDYQAEEITPFPEDEVREHIYQLKILTKVVNTKKVDVSDLNNIEFINNEQLEKDIQMLKGLQTASKVKKINLDEIKVEFKENQQLKADIQRLRDEQNALTKLMGYKEKGERLKAEIDKEMAEFLEKNGGVCESCGQPLSIKHLGGSHD